MNNSPTANCLGVISALMLASVMLTGCNAGANATSTSSLFNTASDDEFDQGADRAPMLKTRFLYARLVAEQGQHREAEALLAGIRQEYADFLPVYLELARIKMEQGRTRRAAYYLGQGLKRSPNDPVLLNNLGVCFMTLKKYDKALTSFTRAAAAAPEDPRYRASVAMTLGVQGRYDEALSLYRQVMDPGLAHYNTALLAEANSSLERAQAEYEQARSLDPALLPMAETPTQEAGY